MITFTLDGADALAPRFANPSIPGISRSSNTKSGSEPPFSNASASFARLLAVSTANSSSSSNGLDIPQHARFIVDQQNFFCLLHFLGPRLGSSGLEGASGIRKLNLHPLPASLSTQTLPPNGAHEAPHYGQTKPRAVRFAALLWDAKKVVKHFQVKFRSDAGACIGHA